MVVNSQHLHGIIIRIKQKTMSDTIHNEVSYKFPSNEILENRREFYCLKRGIGESIEMWFKDVQNRVNYCDFSKFGDVFLIDKFICELNHDERDFFRSKKLSSLQRLNDYFVKKRVDSINGFVNLEEYMSLIDDVKSEQVCWQMKYLFDDYTIIQQKYFLFKFHRMITMKTPKLNRLMNLMKKNIHSLDMNHL